MKTRSDIENRLKSLRVKYAKRYVKKSQERLHTNCSYNMVHAPRTAYKSDKTVDLPMVPKRQVTLVVVQPDAPVRLCMYGCEDPSTWSGNVCDDDSVSRSCPMFKPLQSLQSARAEYMEKLSDDEWVFDNHKDMVALQWALSDRLHKMQLSVLERLILWFQVFFFRKAKPVRQLPEPPIPEDLWEDNAPPPAS